MKDCATQKDLSDCKENCNHKMKEDRHEIKWTIHKHGIILDSKIDDVKLDNNSLKVQMSNMEKTVSELKKEQKDNFGRLFDKIDNLDTKFVTKIEHEVIKWKIKVIILTAWSIILGIIWTWASFIWTLIVDQIK